SLMISYHENGRPLLSNGVKISVSHAGHKLAVLFSRKGVDAGVDLEQVREKVLRIREKFLSPAELADLKEAPLELYTTYWAVKEAVYKAMCTPGLLFAEQIAVQPFSFNRNGGDIFCDVKRNGVEKKFALRYQLMDEYVLVYTYFE